MQKTLVTLAVILLAACTTPVSSGPEGQITSATGGQCSADRMANFVGKQATQELGSEILEASYASVLRWISPNIPPTTDYRIDRVNVSYDDTMVVTRVSCG